MARDANAVLEAEFLDEPFDAAALRAVAVELESQVWPSLARALERAHERGDALLANVAARVHDQ